MRNNYSRYLGYLLNAEVEGNMPKLNILALNISSAIRETRPKILIPPEFNAKDWMTFLLHIDAELEHSLMVQYLYAAYSLGGDHVVEDYKELVRGWQEIILGIAKEEMGHFISVQNVLRVIGAPLNFNRQDFPWDSELYPFEFKLEPLSRSSLAKYIYAESPQNWLQEKINDDEETEAIKKEIKAFVNADKHGDPISQLFVQIINILQDESLIPDEAFIPETYPFQAKFDEWGRGYSAGARGNTTDANPQGTPNILVVPVSSRTDALNAVREIAEQGEAASDVDNQLSHFERFLGIYKIWRKLPPDFTPAKELANNPTTIGNFGTDVVNTDDVVLDNSSLISHPVARLWANLFNVRYRMLLTFLTHSFLEGNGFDNAVNTPRGVIIHAAFGEMYNLRSIAHVLVDLPLAQGSTKKAGPPFQLPYTMDLPTGDMNRWKLHRNLIEASRTLIDSLLNVSEQPHKKYLFALGEADNRLNEIGERIIGVIV